MKANRPSATASYVAMGRALAHARGNVRGFRDPFALGFLDDGCRVVVERCMRGAFPPIGADLPHCGALVRREPSLLRAPPRISPKSNCPRALTDPLASALASALDAVRPVGLK
jgi:hypothetical protein